MKKLPEVLLSLTHLQITLQVKLLLLQLPQPQQLLFREVGVVVADKVVAVDMVVVGAVAEGVVEVVEATDSVD